MYHLLTGGLGLLGSYLIRDLSQRGYPLTLLVRPTRKQSAADRVAECLREIDVMSADIKVLEGDITRPDLGLNAHDLDWAQEHCGAMIHNAASLTFTAVNDQSEPWLSNLNGVQRVIALCAKLGIGEMHHVSTAYVCGLRTGIIYEHESSAGQQHGNDYEASKYDAELLMRNAGFKSLTVYRPSIIVGDSLTGFTSTFHGFYVPLKLLSSVLDRTTGFAASRAELIERVRYGGHRFAAMLQLPDDVGKNYVPVDWVSTVMAHIIATPQFHGTTYHLTPEAPVPMKLTREAMEDVFLEHTELSDHSVDGDIDWTVLEQHFAAGMQVYEAYWRGDPTFDSTNTHHAAGHLPCPRMDQAFFRRLCQYAISTKFGRRRKAQLRAAS